ncbi:MAG: hypothetical protein ACXU86_00730 [Archangium sp.]
MRAVRYVVLSSLLAAAGCGGMDESPTGQAVTLARSSAGVMGSAGTNGIAYHSGPIITATPNVYYIWYGNWSGNTATTILTDLASNIGGTPYYNIVTTYSNGAGVHPPNAVNYAGSTTVAYPYGTSLSDAQIQQVVADAINSAALPKDTNGLYIVYTSADVNASSGFCTQYCGWHTHGTIAGSDIKYAFIGNAARCISSCGAQSTGPNGNAGADAMAGEFAHELTETVTDPDLNAWYDTTGNEMSDKCAWTFGSPIYTVANGAKANVKIGTRDYYLPQLWVNVSPGYCALHYP